MNTCPCCSETLLRHVRNHRIYWYCPNCHQEMPNFAVITHQCLVKEKSTNVEQAKSLSEL